jgi:uncharacterized protein YdhG (YjbR/CyaY superfamily)
MPQKTAKSDVWTAEERAAMKEAVAEAKRAAKRGADEAAGEDDVLAKIAELPEPDRSLAARIHEIVKAAAPALVSKTWYGMPAYARDGKVICFFQAASKFKVRYATFGFQQDAKLDDGAMWPTSYALTELTAGDEERIAELVKKAVR